jgi:processive 1,2-diacylglycerol beta-glucosyltransferase
MRVLIATVTAGGGHLAAAAALEDAWRSFRPEDTLEKLDLVKFFSPLHRKVVSDGYVKIVEHAPELWGLMFKKTDDPEVTRRFNKLKRIFPSNSRARFARFVKKLDPDVVLCTHYLPLETLGHIRSKLIRKPDRRGRKLSPAPSEEGARPFVVSIVTDFEAHALWMNECVDLYCVAAEGTGARLVARGATRDSILATGIPISSRFSAAFDPKAVRRKLGLRDDQPVLLVLSGGFGMGPVAEILAELDKVQQPFQAVVVTGRNEELRRELAAQDRKHPTHILGFASNMHELMAISDLIISKPGGLTTSEALAMGRPLFILNPIPGQEAANSDFLLEHGAAAKVNRVEDLPYRIEQLLGSKKLAAMSRAAKVLGRPTAALDICREVFMRAKPAPSKPTALSTSSWPLTQKLTQGDRPST